MSDQLHFFTWKRNMAGLKKTFTCVAGSKKLTAKTGTSK